uniref:Uncharacterized protein n=1 Tax=Odontella aurita TaxID=265563 RepID=A0A7S4IHJ7_9STRA|mmetsp:Transcript_25147/g.73774  ORF Transcript_25147/g.73774 Transcript_25147/m.73774 type:complete len:129 (+) Transcript_25147:617-1003(+)
MGWKICFVSGCSPLSKAFAWCTCQVFTLKAKRTREIELFRAIILFVTSTESKESPSIGLFGLHPALWKNIATSVANIALKLRCQCMPINVLQRVCVFEGFPWFFSLQLLAFMCIIENVSHCEKIALGV